ncbi:MAG TPA: hypothetical protein VMO76_12820 [Candidatus Udaeobacter sp.]|nr:hypothetical protein [Candidatus Udaeobacter sp.]
MAQSAPCTKPVRDSITFAATPRVGLAEGVVACDRVGRTDFFFVDGYVLQGTYGIFFRTTPAMVSAEDDARVV